jgi:hypothetical protein
MYFHSTEEAPLAQQDELIITLAQYSSSTLSFSDLAEILRSLASLKFRGRLSLQVL